MKINCLICPNEGKYMANTIKENVIVQGLICEECLDKPTRTIETPISGKVKIYEQSR